MRLGWVCCQAHSGRASKHHQLQQQCRYERHLPPVPPTSNWRPLVPAVPARHWWSPVPRGLHDSSRCAPSAGRWSSFPGRTFTHSDEFVSIAQQNRETSRTTINDSDQQTPMRRTDQSCPLLTDLSLRSVTSSSTAFAPKLCWRHRWCVTSRCERNAWQETRRRWVGTPISYTVQIHWLDDTLTRAFCRYSCW